MNNRPNPILVKIMPYVAMAIFLIIIVVGFVLLSYILLIGAIIGLVLFAIGYIRTRFFNKNRTRPVSHQKDEKQGRVFEHKK